MKRIINTLPPNTLSYSGSSAKKNILLTDIQNTLAGTVPEDRFGPPSQTEHSLRYLYPIITISHYNELGKLIDSLPTLSAYNKNCIAGSLASIYLKNPSRQNGGACNLSAQVYAKSCIQKVYGISIDNDIEVPWSTNTIDLRINTATGNNIYISHKAGTATGGVLQNILNTGMTEINSFINSLPKTNEYFVFLCEYSSQGSSKQVKAILDLAANHNNTYVLFDLLDLYPILDTL